IDTKNILFICGGAFDGIDKIIETRVGNSSLGFGATIKDESFDAKGDLVKQVTAHDVVKYGLIPELIGRIPVITVLDNLNEDMLIRILKEPKNSLIKQYQRIMAMDKIELDFTEDSLREIAKKAIERKSGARGLRSIMETMLIPIMYDVSSRRDVAKITVDLNCVQTGVPKLTLF
ncbi:MAG: AAA family ATPase, partial [Oscillospiraceae bacterium]